MHRSLALLLLIAVVAGCGQVTPNPNEDNDPTGIDHSWHARTYGLLPVGHRTQDSASLLVDQFD